MFLTSLVAKSNSSVEVMVKGHILEMFMDSSHWGLGGSLGYTYYVTGSVFPTIPWGLQSQGICLVHLCEE